MRRRARPAAPAWLALGWLACAGSPDAQRALLPPISDGRYAMGTVLEVTVHGVPADEARTAIEASFEEARLLDEQLSVYAPDSDVSRLNRAAGLGAQPVAPAVADILARSIRYAELTHGSFDVTVGPLVELWTRASERDAVPSAADVARALSRVGSEKIRVDGDTAALALAGMSIDLGGVAKGYALDRMRERLADRGIGSALLNFGQSSTWAIGRPSDAPGWRLLVRGPDGGFVGLITLEDRALSVSGSLGQWVEIEGRRYGHILDPRSGEPLIRTRQAVIVAPEAALGEALSKALLVLDAEEGLALVAGLAGCEGLLVEVDGSLHATPGWIDATSFERLEDSPR